MDFVSYDDHKTSWKTYRAACWAVHPQQGDPATDVDWDRHEEESLDACLIELRRRQIMFQGHRWTCRKCHHRNWVDLATLASELSCQVCKQPAQAPVAGATVDFFALDASGTRSVLIGSGLTNASGQYRAVLPDVPAPAN